MKTDDVKLQKNIIDELAYTPDVNSTNIGVSVKDGVVTLTNTVESWSEKIAVEKALKKMSGVRGIANELKIDLPSQHKRNDTDIANAAVKQLEWNITVPADSVKVTVENGILTLSGKVKWDFQKRAAEKCVQHIIGVKCVLNLIEIKTDISPKEVKNNIEKSLERRVEIESNKIHVEPRGNKVILSGSVSSWLIYEEAERAAWKAAGVNAVENNISVNPL